MGSELVPDREWILVPRSPLPRPEMRRRTYRPRTGRFLGTETPRRDRTCFPGNASDVTPIRIQGSSKGVARPQVGPLRKSDRDRSGIRPRTHPGTGRSPRLDGARGETAGSVHHCHTEETRRPDRAFAREAARREGILGRLSSDARYNLRFVQSDHGTNTSDLFRSLVCFCITRFAPWSTRRPLPCGCTLRVNNTPATTKGGMT